jgi:hypothetical protein
MLLPPHNARKGKGEKMNNETLRKVLDRIDFEDVVTAVREIFSDESISSVQGRWGGCLPAANASEVMRDQMGALAFAVGLGARRGHIGIEEVLDGISPWWQMTGNRAVVQNYGMNHPRPEPDGDGGRLRTLRALVPIAVRAWTRQELSVNDRRDGPRDEWEDELPEETWTWEYAVQETEREARRRLCADLNPVDTREVMAEVERAIDG